MDAVLEYCKKKEIEPESVTRLISKSLKDKIANARDLNYLPNQNQSYQYERVDTKLPI